VQDLQLGPLRWTRDGLSTDYLRLSGSIEGYSFEISVDTLKASYEWRELWRGTIKSLALSQLAVSLEEVAVEDGGTEEPLVLSEVSPHALLSRLPLQRITVEQWRLAYKPLQGTQVKAEGDLSWERSLALSYAAVLPWVRVSGELRAPDQDSMAVALQMRHQDTILGNVQAALQRASPGGWQWSIDGDVTLAPLPGLLRALRQDHGIPLDATLAEDVQLAGEVVFDLTLAHPDSLVLPATVTGDFVAQFIGDINVSAAVSELTVGDLVTASSGSATASAHLADNTLAVTLGPTAWQGELTMAALGLSEDARNWLRWEDTVPLRWRSPGDASLRLEKTGAVELHLVDNQLQLGDQRSALYWHGLKLQARLEESAPDGPPTPSLALALEARLDTRLRNREIPQLRLSVAQQGSLSQSDFTLALLDTAESLQLELAGELSPETGQGEYHAQLRSLDLTFASSVVVPLLQKFDVLQQALVIDSGSFSLDSQLRSREFTLDGLEQKSVLNIVGVSGSYGEYQFGGLDISADWQGVQRWQTLEPAELALARLNVGFEVIAIRALLSLPQATAPVRPLVTVDTFEAGMFGGRVYLSAPRSWDFDSASNSATLRVEDWSLAEMVALQPGQDIQAQGVLEGELPVTLADGRIIIDKGFLRARAPGGKIRYRASAASEALSAGSSELALAMSLLEDFQYRTLSSEVELDPQGNLLLGLALEGSNPAHYEGRSIRFNINLEQNLDPLLQSLRLSDSLVERVEKGLR